MANKKDAQPVHPFVILKVNGSETNELNRFYGISDKKRPKMGLFCSYMTKRDLKYLISLYLQGE